MEASPNADIFRQVNAWIGEAVTELGKGRLNEARELFLKVVEGAPTFADAYYNLGVICDLQKNPDESIRYYAQALKYNPRHAECLTNLGAAHSNAGRFAIAIPFLNRAIQSNPLLLQPRLNLGITYRHLERPAEALEALRGAIGLDPGNGYVLYLSGCAAHELGLHTDAERFLRAALAVKPDYTDPLILLVDVLIELEDPSQAVEVLEKFVGANPKNAAARECLRRIRSSPLSG